MQSRRGFLASASFLALAGAVAPGWMPAAAFTGRSTRRQPLPLRDVRLKPSIFADAVERNSEYLLFLSPDRLLHNFHLSAGLEPRGPVYGGWEARGIAGHTLGHYLTACALAYAQTGRGELRERVAYVVDQLAMCQAAHGDGYVGGTTVERNGEVVDGKIIFEELRDDDIRTGGFDINGGWVPLYTWHKVQAGLIDALRHAELDAARPVLLGMAAYLAEILEGLDDSQMQTLLAAEHGGLNEVYAELYALTGERRWLTLAERIRHRSVLDPLAAGADPLPGLHANTQIPKVIGLARLHELTGETQYRETSEHFYALVTDHYSYVIGGNSEREHFPEPDVIAGRLTDRTCEACNTYNMLKLARHLHAWSGDPAILDYYERAHLNHIMAHQHPQTGGFVYFMPLASGSRRIYSEPEDSFWCCVGSGMESHAKHGESIWWEDEGGLYLNLYYASRAHWRNGGMTISLDTDFPMDEQVTITIEDAPDADRSLALRIPGWCANPELSINGALHRVEVQAGYLRLTRRWRAGDVIRLRLPMALSMETPPDAPNLTTYLHGPLVLGADLGDAAEPYEALPPALISADPGAALQATGAGFAQYAMGGAEPRGLTLSPFFSQYDRRSAVYFPSFTPEEWALQRDAFEAEQRAEAVLQARTVDVIHLGEMQPERDHDFRFNQADLIAFGGLTGRQAWWGEGNWMAFDLAVDDGPMILQALYWGEEINKDFEVRVDGQLIARERRDREPDQEFHAVDYPLPLALTQGKDEVEIRFVTRGTDAPVYVARMLREEG
ncbi:beta-L-arabinofuranosidase domain-containing protein [Oceanicaulis sp.]|uniref:beta-L-arabinofuranosidase domain-containing protein n=1 Tax=Oceanicaulis sp. TaxID=1924941 RepID=UPI003F70394C